MARPPRPLPPLPPTIRDMLARQAAKKRERALSPFRLQLLDIIAELDPYAQTSAILARYNELNELPTTFQTIDTTLRALTTAGYVTPEKKPSLLRETQLATFFTLTDKATALRAKHNAA